ncbi:MAG: CHASE3 domain-containing protein [Candidatus Rokubacteria bacterium]|nr:CHASE3 domain-containing protein [Candidatus Rokubacteria bacterium]
MSRNLTFGLKIGLGFAATVAVAFMIGILAVYTLKSVVASKDRVIEVDSQLLTGAERLRAAVEQKIAAARGYFMSPQETYLEDMRQARSEFTDEMGRLKQLVYTEEGKRALDAIQMAEADHQAAIDRLVSLRQNSTNLETMARMFSEQVTPKRVVLNHEVEKFVEREQRLLEDAKRASTSTATLAINLVIAMASGAVLLASTLAFFLTRSLARQIGTAVGQVQSSSAELQAAASQQASGAKEQASAMSEISTTISELLATSRQIAESAQRVAHIAEETAGAARKGEGTVEKTHGSITGIRRQADLVVSHMLDLGKKSQQIGAVLEIVSELAEQTNILAVNATIEAAGAGEAGKRFAIVADEIRKLADRVAGSAKEIRGLIEDVRSAVNTTVMATETGSKTVDDGSKQFAEVTAVFKQIASLLTTTTEAAREIGLSTKQQATAVEQVNVAISNVAQATRETETSSSQTLQTASQLTGLSRDLLRLIQSQAAA